MRGMRGDGGAPGSYIMADWWRMRIGCFSFHLSLQRKRLSQWGQCHQDRRCFHDNQEPPPPPPCLFLIGVELLHWDKVFKRWRCCPCTERKWEERLLRPRRGGAVLCLPSPVVVAPLVRSFSSTLMFYSAHIKLCLLIVTLLVLNQTLSVWEKL